MFREINLSEARRRLSALVREIEADPSAGYRLKVRDSVVAELRRPAPGEGCPNAGEALLRAADRIARLHRTKPKGPQVTSENYKEFLYGNWPPADSGRRR